MFRNDSIYLPFMLIVLAAAFVGGCKRHTDDDNEQISVAREDADSAVVVIVDLSPSFADWMTRDGKGYDFTLRAADTYFRSSIGTNNRIIIGQLSGTNRALLWDGTPVQLRQDFPSADDFRDFLLKKSDPNGSRIYDGIADSLSYVLTDPSIMNGKTRTAVLVLSDFDDNLSDPQGEQRLAQLLNAFAKTNGVVGFYFLDQLRMPTWREHLRQSGIKHWVCESEIVAHPPFPTFE